MHIDLVTIIVADYDAAIRFFVDALGFELAQDEPSTTNDGRAKRWVVVRPPNSVTGILLAQADGDVQAAAIGKQMAGRVGFFLRVDDFEAAHARMTAAGVEFVTPARTEPYGQVAVFLDVAGNRWDLLGPARVTADPARISVTAKLSAYYRKYTDIAFAAEVATLIGADEAFAQLVRDHALEPDKLTFYAPMFEARYKSITELIRECAASQVLELASGYSLRGLDLTQHGSLRYVETDLRDVVATKLELLANVRQRHGIAPNPSHVVTVADALDLDQLRAATAGLDRARPLMVLGEGLVGYLTREETGRLTANVHRLLTEFSGGWWLVPDFTFKTDIRSLPPERLRLREAVTGVTQRQLDASAFEDSADLESFLQGAGFDIQVCSQVDKTPSFSSISALDLSPTMLDRLRPLLRVWVMTPSHRAGRA